MPGFEFRHGGATRGLDYDGQRLLQPGLAFAVEAQQGEPGKAGNSGKGAPPRRRDARVFGLRGERVYSIRLVVTAIDPDVNRWQALTSLHWPVRFGA